jgi:hypothetical protein
MILMVPAAVFIATVAIEPSLMKSTIIGQPLCKVRNLRSNFNGEAARADAGIRAKEYRGVCNITIYTGLCKKTPLHAASVGQRGEKKAISEHGRNYNFMVQCLTFNLQVDLMNSPRRLPQPP